MWQRAGVLGHVSDSTPLVIPYRSIGARERTPGPKPNCACTALLRPLPSFFSRPKGRESTLVLHWTSFTLEANSRPKLPTLGPFSPFFASGVDSRPKKSKISRVRFVDTLENTVQGKVLALVVRASVRAIMLSLCASCPSTVWHSLRHRCQSCHF